jgi:hypothetical protein
MHVEDLPWRKHYHIDSPAKGTFDWVACDRAADIVRPFLTVELYTHTEHPQEAAEKSYAS